MNKYYDVQRVEICSKPGEELLIGSSVFAIYERWRAERP
jgi:hypothetical protein